LEDLQNWLLAQALSHAQPHSLHSQNLASAPRFGSQPCTAGSSVSHLRMINQRLAEQINAHSECASHACRAGISCQPCFHCTAIDHGLHEVYEHFCKEANAPAWLTAPQSLLDHVKTLVECMNALPAHTFPEWTVNGNWQSGSQEEARGNTYDDFQNEAASALILVMLMPKLYAKHLELPALWRLGYPPASELVRVSMAKPRSGQGLTSARGNVVEGLLVHWGRQLEAKEWSVRSKMLEAKNLLQDCWNMMRSALFLVRRCVGDEDRQVPYWTLTRSALRLERKMLHGGFCT
jgi:hypothetical protein